MILHVGQHNLVGIEQYANNISDLKNNLNRYLDINQNQFHVKRQLRL